MIPGLGLGVGEGEHNFQCSNLYEKDGILKSDERPAAVDKTQQFITCIKRLRETPNILIYPEMKKFDSNVD